MKFGETIFHFRKAKLIMIFLFPFFCSVRAVVGSGAESVSGGPFCGAPLAGNRILVNFKGLGVIKLWIAYISC